MKRRNTTFKMFVTTSKTIKFVEYIQQLEPSFNVYMLLTESDRTDVNTEVHVNTPSTLRSSVVKKVNMRAYSTLRMSITDHYYDIEKPSVYSKSKFTINSPKIKSIFKHIRLHSNLIGNPSPHRKDYPVAVQRRFVSYNDYKNENIQFACNNWMDRKDKFISSIPSEYLQNYSGDTMHMPSKVIEHLYGLHNYTFSESFQLSVTPENFDEFRPKIIAMIVKFLDELEDKTVFKCMLIGVTDDQQIKTPKEGAFYISRETRTEYIYMKIKNTISIASFNYIEEEFVNCVLSYKV